jgi:hypothetical protein
MGMVTVALNGKMAMEFEAYAQETGITLEAAVNKALDAWMDETGRFVYVELVKRRGNQGRVRRTKARLAV